jgi:transcriptional regulator with XRE-family HTH domain
MMEDPELGHKLRVLRTAAGRTVASVAQDAGLSVPYIANLENGRGNPTLSALDRLASALGMKLAVSLIPAGDGLAAGPDAAIAAAELPGTLVRLRRTAEFRRATEAMALGLGLEQGDFSTRLTGALATLAAALGTEPSEADWWRLLDALLLMATLPRNRAR